MIGYAELFGVFVIGFGYFLLPSALTWRKLAIYAAMVSLTGGMLITSLGTPKPALLQLSRVEGALLAYSVDEGHAVYVWVRPDSSPVPVAIALAWSQRTAAQIERAAAQGKAQHRGVRVSVGGAGFGLSGEAKQSGEGKGTGAQDGGDSLPGDDPRFSASLAPVEKMPAKASE